MLYRQFFEKVSRNRNIRLYIAGTGSAHFVKKMKSLIEKEGIEGKKSSCWDTVRMPRS